jgi:hypothetical protein
MLKTVPRTILYSTLSLGTNKRESELDVQNYVVSCAGAVLPLRQLRYGDDNSLCRPDLRGVDCVSSSFSLLFFMEALTMNTVF